jgi:hypothetical protein
MKKVVLSLLVLSMSLVYTAPSHAAVSKANKVACAQAQGLIAQMYMSNMASDSPIVHDAKWEKSVKLKATKLRSYAKPATGNIKSTINNMASIFDKAIKLKNDENASFENSMELLTQANVLDALCK